MDFLYLAYYLSLFVTPLILYVIIFGKRRISYYNRPTWYYNVKKIFAAPSIKRLQDEYKYVIKRLSELDQELPQKNSTKYESDNYIIYGADTDGNVLSIILNFKHTLHMDVSIEFRSKCGKIYKLPNEPLIEIKSVNSRCWRGAGLNIEILNPLRRLRITYNGIMRCSSFKMSKPELEYVNFRFFWNAGSEPVYYPHGVSPDLLSDAVAREPWKDGEWIRMLGSECGFEQYGVLQGHLSATSLGDDLYLYLPSWRRRIWGPSDCLTLKRDFHVFGVSHDGTVFCVGAKSYRIGATQLRYGTVLLNNGEVMSITSSDVSLEHLADNMEIPNVFTIHFKVNNKTFKCVSHLNTNKTSTTQNNAERGYVVKSTNIECDLNSDQVKGFVRFWYRQNGQDLSLPEPLLAPKSVKNPQEILVRSLMSVECLDGALTGGKGNSLALLSTIISNEFTVPPGFVVTTTCFRKFLAENLNLTESIKTLEEVCCGVIEGNPEDVCKNTVELFKDARISPELTKILEDEIKEIKDEFSSKGSAEWSWAVRSSGIGEDSDELSAAGQNATFLGCKTTGDVIKAICGCWGSLFTYQSVEYRRQHGLLINSDIAVVVQKMIPSECAGVLFTSHPATGDPSQMVITSNYGLGESVVSASCDPDTIILAKSIKGNVKVLASTVGTKKTQITLSEVQDKDTEEKEVDEKLAQELSLDENQALKLGKIGVFLERAFGNPRDIEWAFYNGELFILQSRPITTLNTWNEWELQHEFDTPVFSKDNLYSRANVGEVIKGAVSPLTQSITMHVIDVLMQMSAYKGEYQDFYRKGLPINSHVIFLNVLNFMYNRVKGKILMENRVSDLAIFGHLVLNEKILKTALKRHGKMNFYQTMSLYYEQFHTIFENDFVVKKAIEFNQIWNIKLKSSDSAKSILDKIDFNLQSVAVASEYHLHVTQSSIVYQMIAMIVLAEKHNDFNNDHYHDIALLLATNSGVESAEIPIILEGIAVEIRKEGFGEEFARLKPEEGMKWLEEKMPSCKVRLEKFLTLHGHRAFREFELYENTWGMKPEIVISMIQSNCLSETTTKKAVGLTVDETISALISPSKNITKKILKFIVKKCRKAVAHRETTKSVFIKTIHKFRLVFNELGKAMVKESLIPAHDVVFFFTIEELRDHIKERNPILVSKAIRRRKLYEKWNSLHFPELIYGVPIPEQQSVAFKRTENNLKIHGTPVCKGNIVGRACVITDIKEINLVQSGDILITFSTDIAWSPYFPILSGVVTEIGGLISHGAVVAREYGLPCVVGAQNATKYFKTGDKILLDGKTGVIELVE
ncbi:rifampicin phosphotransferase-like [Onthophagus taurus]|uniref:rifampicin phosphotransferase-like n=1 Tax=Onthophagus taurus TaxID=166361 RepID=UPI0039BEA178